MRRLMVGFLASVLLAGCSSSVPRNSAVFSPTVPPATASAQAGTSSAATVDTSAWTTLAPQGEGFSAQMPGQPTSSSGSGSSVAGGYTYTYWIYTDSSGRIFEVSLTKFGKGALSGPNKTILDGTQTSYLSSFPGSKIESQGDTTLGGHPGRTVVFANSTTRVRGEMILVGDNSYIFGVSYPVGLADSGVANAFMASFKLTV